MSLRFAGSTSGSFAQVDRAVALAPPFTVSFWFRTSQPDRGADTYLFWLGKRGSSQDWFAVALANGKLRIEARSTSAWPMASTSNLVVANTAQHACAVFGTSSARQIILNGDRGGSGISSVAATPAQPDRTALARASDATPSGGALVELGFVAVHDGVLSVEHQALLAQGAHPASVPGLVECWPLDSDANPAGGLLGTELRLALTGATLSGWQPPVQSAPPAPPPAGAGAAVKKVWTSGLLGKRYPGVRLDYVEFDAVEIPPAAGRRLFAILPLMPFAAGTALESVRFAGGALERITPDRWGGPESAANVTIWTALLDDLPATTGRLRAECDQALWCGAVYLVAVDDAGTDWVAVNDADPAAQPFIQATVATVPGSLCLFVGAMQGRDGLPVGLQWTGGTVDGLDATSGDSDSTDLAVIAAAKLVTSGMSETARANFATSDGRGWAMISIPPATPGSGGAVAGQAQLAIGVDDAAVTAAADIPGDVTLILAAEIDDDAGELRLRVGDGPVQVVPWTGARNPGDGPLVLGQRLVAGLTQGQADHALVRALVSTSRLDARELALAGRWVRECLAPVTRRLVLAVEVASVTLIDLTPAVADPGGYGWQAVRVDAPATGFVQLVDAHRVRLDLSDWNAPVAVAFRVQVASLGPGQPSTALPVLVVAGGIALDDHQVSVRQDGTVLVDVLLGALDSQGAVPVLDALSDPAHGTARIESQKARYTPDRGYVGPDAFSYTVRSQATGAVASGQVLVEVKPADDPPPSPPPPPSGGQPASRVDVGINGQRQLLDVVWAHDPTAADVAAYAAKATAQAKADWLRSYIRQKWAGRGSVNTFKDWWPNTAQGTSLELAPDGSPAYRFFQRRRRRVGDSDGKQWFGSQVGVPWKQNGGVEAAASIFHLWMPPDYNNYLNDPKLNPQKIGMPFKMWWLFWGGPWLGTDVDDVSPAAGGDNAAQQRTWSVRAQCNKVGGSLGEKIGFKGYMYIKGRPGTGTVFGAATRYSPAFVRGAWNEIKAYCKVNTITNGRGNDDGILRLWLNGELFYSANNLNIRGAEPWLIQGCGPIYYSGGNNSHDYHQNQRDQSYWFRGIKMAV